MDDFLQSFFSDDKPLTLGILIYIVYMLHKSDQKQNKAIKWLRGTLANLLIRVDNLEQFYQRKFPDEYRKPPNSSNFPYEIDNDDDDL